MRHSQLVRPAAATAWTAVAALAATLLAACGEKNATDPLPREIYGASSIRSTGGVSVSAEGIAFYGPFGSAITGGNGFMLVLGTLAADSTLDHLVALTRERANAPGTGSYPLYDAIDDAAPSGDAFTAFAVLGNAGGRPVVCFATSGALTVSSSAGGHLKGSFTARADCLDDDGDEVAQTTITGTFDAVDGTNLSGLPRTSRAVGVARAARTARAPR